jgi:hypothetical protein
LISGVSALNFFELGWSNVPILDLFVEAGGQTDGLVAYIKDREDYNEEENLEITMVRGLFLLDDQAHPFIAKSDRV